MTIQNFFTTQFKEMNFKNVTSMKWILNQIKFKSNILLRSNYEYNA